MIHQLFFQEDQRSRLFAGPLYRGLCINPALYPSITHNCPELKDPRNQPLLSEYCGMLYCWRNPDVDPDPWIGFTSYRQFDKFPTVFEDRSTVEEGLHTHDIIGWGFYEFYDVETRRRVSQAEHSERCHPGIMSSLWRLLLSRNETVPPAFLTDNLGLYCNYWIMAKAHFHDFMDWSYPMIQLGLEEPDAYIRSHPRSLAYLVERLFICWYMRSGKRLQVVGEVQRIATGNLHRRQAVSPEPLKVPAWNATLPELCRRHGVRPRGIVHIGAHYAEERDLYVQTGATAFLWIEADPANMAVLQANLAGRSNTRAIQACLADTDGQSVPFYRTDNRGESSSILPMGTHRQHFQNIHVQETTALDTVTFATLVDREGIALDEYDFLVLDVQGAELLVLRGMGELLGRFHGVYVEVNLEELYRGCALLPQMDAYLGSHGFSRRETLLTTKNYGDALYLRDDAVPQPTAGLDQRADDARRQVLLERSYLLHYVRHGGRILEFLEPWQIGSGATPHEQTWLVRSAGPQVLLELFGHQGRACYLERVNDVVWRGASLVQPGLEVELIPAALVTLPPPPPAYPVGSNLPLDLVERLRDSCALASFIETGTARGVSAQLMASRFAYVYTVELDPAAHTAARQALAPYPNVEARLGDSAQELAAILGTISGPALIWLDAHWSGTGTASAAGECPLMEELQAVYRHRADHVVLIDDARLFLLPPAAPHRASDWPTVGQIGTFLAEQCPAPLVRVVGDIIVAVPPSAKGTLDAYCQEKGQRP